MSAFTWSPANAPLRKAVENQTPESATIYEASSENERQEGGQ